MLKIKLFMWDMRKNLGTTTRCMKCKEPESEEHILQCNKVSGCIMKENHLNLDKKKTILQEKTKYFVKYGNDKESKMYVKKRKALKTKKKKDLKGNNER